MHSPRFRIPVLLALLLATAGCSDSTGPYLSSRLAAGTYTLVSVEGRGPESGSFVLGAGALAARHVRYADVDGEYTAVGTFKLTPDSIVFELHEDGGRSEHTWTVRGEFKGTSFVIRYPDPADGVIIETYRRL